MKEFNHLINNYKCSFRSALFSFLFLLFSFTSHSQVFWTENFGTGTNQGQIANGFNPSINGSWSVTSTGTNAASANEWFISSSEAGMGSGACGDGCTNTCVAGLTNRTLHIGSSVSVVDANAVFQVGAIYNTDKRAESPVISCVGHTNITLSFNYLVFGNAGLNYCQVYYFDGTTWTALGSLVSTPHCNDCNAVVRGQWSSAAFSQVLPVSSNNNANVKIGFRWINSGGFGNNPSVAIDDITLASPVANSITTGTISGSPFCACTIVSVPFAIAGTFTAGNVFTAQLSNAAGSFAAPVTIGTLTGTAAGTITCTIPCNTAAGIGYIIRVISSTPSITGSSSVAITIKASPIATFSYTGTPYCQNAANPFPTYSGGGVAGSFSGSPGIVFQNIGTGQINLGGSNTGTFTVTNTVASGGCTNSATSTVTINPAQDASFFYPAPTAYCKTSANPFPNISGTLGGTFTSTPAGLVFVTPITNPGQINLAASTAGTYIITYTTPGPNCINSSTASITITTPPVATFSYTGTPYCQNATNPSPTFTGGGTAGLFSSTTGLIFVNASTGQINLSTSTPGAYTITNTIAASGGCAGISATSNVVINPIQDSTFTYPASSFCISGTNPSPIIYGTPGGNFTATPAGLVFVSSASGIINLVGSAIGSYSVKYTTPGPCSTSLTVPISIISSPVATFNYAGTPYCQNAANPSPTFTGGGTAGIFSSTTGLNFVNTSTGQINLATSTPGTYTITNNIAAANGCVAVTATSNIVINPVTDSTFSYSSNTFCQSGTNPIPSIAAVGGTFTSSPTGLVFVSAATGEISLAGSAPGTYNVRYTTPAPCSTSLTVSITITNIPVATFSYIGSQYCTNAVNPSPSFSGGGSAGVFSSTSGLNFVNINTGQVNLTSSTAGTYSVTNTIPAAGGCPLTTATSIITITALPIGDFSYTGTPYCLNAANPTPILVVGSSAGTFSSTGSLAFVSTTTGQVDLSTSTAGTYTVTNTIPASGGCPVVTGTSNITITAPSVGTFTYTSTPYCQNAANPLPVYSGGGVAGTFSTSAGLSINSGNGLVNLASSTPGSYVVTNSIAATGGCAATTYTAPITINALPVVTVNSSTICSGQTATLTANGAVSYSWSAGVTSTGTNTATVSPATNSSYTVTGTTNGCSATAVASIAVNNCHLVPNFTADNTTFCLSGCANFTDLTTGNPTSWTWLFPGGTPSSSNSSGPINVCYPAGGPYTVTLIVSNAVSTDTLIRPAYINIVSPMQSAIIGNTTINACESTQLTVQPAGSSYLWGPNVAMQCGNCQSVTVAPTTTQEYYVNYIDVNGCSLADTIIVDVTSLYTYFMPTGFSPNGDGNNDILYVKGRGIDYIDLRIFDRIGEKVFESTSIDSGWDGTLHGIIMNDNSFDYTLDVTYCNGQSVKERGTLTLVR